MISDDVNAEIDRRKGRALVDQGIISMDEIANAPIVFECSCGHEQPINNDICERCGKDIS